MRTHELADEVTILELRGDGDRVGIEIERPPAASKGRREVTEVVELRAHPERIRPALSQQDPPTAARGPVA